MFGAHIFTLGNENGNGIGAPMNQNEIGALRWKWRWKCNWIWTLGSLEPLPIPFSFLKRKWKWNWTSNELEDCHNFVPFICFLPAAKHAGLQMALLLWTFSHLGKVGSYIFSFGEGGFLHFPRLSRENWVHK